MNPATFLRVCGPEPWNVCYPEPSVRPDDSRYGRNPNRVQRHTQFQASSMGRQQPLPPWPLLWQTSTRMGASTCCRSGAQLQAVKTNPRPSTLGPMHCFTCRSSSSQTLATRRSCTWAAWMPSALMSPPMTYALWRTTGYTREDCWSNHLLLCCTSKLRAEPDTLYVAAFQGRTITWDKAPPACWHAHSSAALSGAWRAPAT